ncbi:hypothetical protein [Legionella brunensis]|uniref:Methyltransferase domain-containing protein n=1 Tax=Legionella brunensis TaxID=29422 RepID=A0A0W0SP94_9GAMM|nr:hypothetical protein [Legionella brunensis]KTC85037.1 hypothetical protein Lbru_1252 [Legionella brunensis]
MPSLQIPLTLLPELSLLKIYAQNASDKKDLLKNFIFLLENLNNLYELMQFIDLCFQQISETNNVEVIKNTSLIINFINNNAHLFSTLGIELNKNRLAPLKTRLQSRNYLLSKVLANCMSSSFSQETDKVFSENAPTTIFIIKPDSISPCVLNYSVGGNENTKLIEIKEIKIYLNVELINGFSLPMQRNEHAIGWIQITTLDNEKLLIANPQRTFFQSLLVASWGLYKKINTFDYSIQNKEHNWQDLSTMDMTLEQYESLYKPIRNDLLKYFDHYLQEMLIEGKGKKLCLLEIGCGSAQMLHLAVEKAKEYEFEVLAIGFDTNTVAIAACQKQYSEPYYHFSISDMINVKTDLTNLCQQKGINLNDYIVIGLACGAVTHFVMEGSKQALPTLQQMWEFNLFLGGGLRTLSINARIAKSIGYNAIIFSPAENIILMQGKDSSQLLGIKKKELAKNPNFLDLSYAASPVEILKLNPELLSQVEVMDLSYCTFSLTLNDIFNPQVTRRIKHDLANLFAAMPKLELIEFYCPVYLHKSNKDSRNQVFDYLSIYEEIDKLLKAMCLGSQKRYRNFAGDTGYFKIYTGPEKEVPPLSTSARSRLNKATFFMQQNQNDEVDSEYTDSEEESNMLEV